MLRTPRTLVVQSYKKDDVPLWIARCQQSVEHWANQNRFTYFLLGDELFDYNPTWFQQKIGDRKPILSDLARLLYIKEALDNFERVLWLDIDVLIFAPSQFLIAPTPYLFGEERWIQPHKKGWKIYKNACNAFCQFERGNPFLDFYIDTILRIIKRADPNYIAPQMIGPKLLSALHSAVTLPLTTHVGSASPWLIRELAGGKTDLLSKVCRSLGDTPCVALNLCHSLVQAPTSEESIVLAMDCLISYGALLSPKTVS